MAATDAKPVPRKNEAYRLVFSGIKGDGTLITSGTGMDSEVSLDQGTFADCTSEATEIATASGVYYLDLTAAEMNADCVSVKVTWTNTGALTQLLVLYPEETGDIRVNVTQMTAGVIAAASFAAGAFDAVWTVTTRVLTAATNLVLAKGAGVTGFTDISAAQVNAEVLGALGNASFAEPAAGAPPATASIGGMLHILYTVLRNKKVATATGFAVRNDADSATLFTISYSDDGTTFTSDEAS